jgi:hypothetical protein
VVRHWGTWLILASLLLWWVLLYAHSGQSDIWGPDSPDDHGANVAMWGLRWLVAALAVGPALLAGVGLVAIWPRRRRA